jgi:hypothetical protein
MRYSIDFKEIVTRRVEITADSEEEAIEKAKTGEFYEEVVVASRNEDYEILSDIHAFVDTHDADRVLEVDLARDSGANQVLLVSSDAETLDKVAVYLSDKDLVEVHRLLGKQIRKMKKEGRL